MNEGRQRDEWDAERKRRNRNKRIAVFGCLVGKPQVVTGARGSHTWIGVIRPDGAARGVEVRAKGGTADYLIEQAPSDGDRLFASGVRRHYWERIETPILVCIGKVSVLGSMSESRKWRWYVKLDMAGTDAALE